MLEAIHRRLSRLATEERRLRTAWRLATGLGSSHPTENGFTFDWNVGVPFLPGSSLKGLALAHARLIGMTEDRVTALFGLQRDEDRVREDWSASGDLVFLPAYPSRWPDIEVDVVNCHHPEYHGDRPGSRPARPAVDYENPNPVFFLTVASDQDFIFRLFSRTGDLRAVERGFQLLEEGLGTLGVGAKTAVGYGLLAPVS